MNRTFDARDQSLFADLSGDTNPIYTDPITARRLLYGSHIIHGVHGLLWALDCWLAGKTQTIALKSLRTIFAKPIRPKDEVHYQLSRETEDSFEMNLRVGEDVVTVIKASWEVSQRSTCLAGSEIGDVTCRDRDLQSLVGTQGVVPLAVSRGAAEELLPNVCRALCPQQLAQLLAISRMVGMDCPGMHSILGEIQLGFRDESSASEESAIEYNVTHFDERFSAVTMNVVGDRMYGSVKAFVRPKPQQQVSSKLLREEMDGELFRGQRAVVVGGSRGLGEVTAKILAAGGADVVVTYLHGATEAKQIVEEINSAGGNATAMVFNALYPRFDIPRYFGADWTPTDVYYFATPRVVTGKNGQFGENSFSTYAKYFLFGFQETFHLFHSFGVKKFYYPSTQFVDRPALNMGEFGAAKAAGEKLCEFLMQCSPDVDIQVPRLPRLATDQTANFIPVNKLDPTGVMLQSLRQRASGTVPQSLQLVAEVT